MMAPFLRGFAVLALVAACDAEPTPNVSDAQVYDTPWSGEVTCDKKFVDGGTYKKPDDSETLVIDRVTGKVTWTFVQAGKTYTATYTIQGSEF